MQHCTKALRAARASESLKCLAALRHLSLQYLVPSLRDDAAPPQCKQLKV
jgi:hypothetical protein